MFRPVRTHRQRASIALAGMLMFALVACTPSPEAGVTRSTRSGRSEVVRFIVGVSPGGGQDLYARLMAPYLARHLPGQPGVVIENQPGAGGLIAATHLARRAAPDGLTVGLLGVQAVLAQILDEAPPFDVRDLPLIGSPSGDGAVCVFSRSGGVTLDAWQHGRTPRIGVTNRTSTTASYAFLVAAALGLPIRSVVGYAGTSDIKAAMTSGEVDGLCLSRSSFVAMFHPPDVYSPLLQIGDSDVAALANVPRASDLVSTDRGRQLVGVATMVGRLARYLALPPRTPPERVEAFRTAFDRTMHDPEFLALAARARLDISPQSAATLTTQVHELLTLPPDVRRDVVEALVGVP